MVKTPLLELKNVSKSFGGVNALLDIDFTVHKGEIYCLIGENGSGKSTLIKIISGVYPMDSGELQIDGESRRRISPAESIKAGIQVIYQDFSIFPNLSVAENIALSNLFINNRKTVNLKEIRRIAAASLEKIGVDLPLEKCVGELPVAAKQITAIARGLAQDVRLLIMDEPTTALTHKEILALYGIIDNLKKKGVAVIFVSHKLEEVFNISEKIAILRNGKKVLDDRVENFDKNSLAFHMTGREIPSVPYVFNPPAAGAVPVLSVRGLAKEEAFEDITFSLWEGEILGITGQLGSGRTELAKALFGIGRTLGEIVLDSRIVRINSPVDALRLGIAYVPEDRLNEGLFLGRSLTDNVITAAVDRIADGILLKKEVLLKKTRAWIEELGIAAESPAMPASNLSGGNQQRIVLAKWLETKPRLLVLNCPTVGVDVGSKNQIHEIVKQLATKGIAILVVSDDIGEILTLCSRVLLMKNGRMVQEIKSSETTSAVLEQAIVAEE
jgi:simple sugar transport system ATP-binding protein